MPEVERLRAQIGAELDAGELESLALWKNYPYATIVCDDLAARETAKAMGAAVIGTLGLVVKAVKQGRINLEPAISLIQSIPETTTLHVSADLLEHVVVGLKARIG